jgi:hypothetical protein
MHACAMTCTLIAIASLKQDNSFNVSLSLIVACVVVVSTCFAVVCVGPHMSQSSHANANFHVGGQPADCHSHHSHAPHRPGVNNENEVRSAIFGGVPQYILCQALENSVS